MSARLTERSDVKSPARIYPEEARPSADEGSMRGDFSPRHATGLEMTG